MRKSVGMPKMEGGRQQWSWCQSGNGWHSRFSRVLLTDQGYSRGEMGKQEVRSGGPGEGCENGDPQCVGRLCHYLGEEGDWK